MTTIEKNYEIWMHEVASMKSIDKAAIRKVQQVNKPLRFKTRDARVQYFTEKKIASGQLVWADNIANSTVLHGFIINQKVNGKYDKKKYICDHVNDTANKALLNSLLVTSPSGSYPTYLIHKADESAYDKVVKNQVQESIRSKEIQRRIIKEKFL
jgi:hypothetical protein